jgi:replication-associated recombination protein RarA
MSSEVLYLLGGQEFQRAIKRLMAIKADVAEPESQAFLAAQSASEAVEKLGLHEDDLAAAQEGIAEAAMTWIGIQSGEDFSDGFE